MLDGQEVIDWIENHKFHSNHMVDGEWLTFTEVITEEWGAQKKAWDKSSKVLRGEDEGYVV